MTTRNIVEEIENILEQKKAKYSKQNELFILFS